MKICVIAPSEGFLKLAGVRIRYQRIDEYLKKQWHSLSIEVIDNFRSISHFKHDVYLFSKCNDARSFLLARLLNQENKLVGVDFFDDYDLLLCPTSIVAPYPVNNRYVSSCSGVNFDNYIDWLAIVYAITLVSLPALSLPCGFTKSGLPVGLQMIARPRGDAELLSYALQLEESLSLDLKPIDPIKKG